MKSVSMNLPKILLVLSALCSINAWAMEIAKDTATRTDMKSEIVKVNESGEVVEFYRLDARGFRTHHIQIVQKRPRNGTVPDEVLKRFKFVYFSSLLKDYCSKDLMDFMQSKGTIRDPIETSRDLISFAQNNDELVGASSCIGFSEMQRYITRLEEGIQRQFNFDHAEEDARMLKQLILWSDAQLEDLYAFMATEHHGEVIEARMHYLDR